MLGHLYTSDITLDRGIALPLVTLEDSTVVMLGYGTIGRETAARPKHSAPGSSPSPDPPARTNSPTAWCRRTTRRPRWERRTP
jgi:hypothetical protein